MLYPTIVPIRSWVMSDQLLNFYWINNNLCTAFASIHIVPVVQCGQFLHLLKHNENLYRYAQVSLIPGGKIYYTKVAGCGVWVTYMYYTYAFDGEEFWTVAWMLLFASVIEANTTVCKILNQSVNNFKRCRALRKLNRQTDWRT